MQCNAMQCGLEFSQNHNCTAPHFCGHMCDTTYKMRFEVNIFFKFWTFPTQLKTNFSFFFGSSFKLLSQFFFILGWLSQSTLVRVIKRFFFFFGKTRVIKLLIIYLILKIINILIYRENAMRCGLCGFLTIKLKTALHHTVRCHTVHYYLRCGAVIPFYERFWFSFCGLCGLCGLVNTPTNGCPQDIG